MPNTVKVNCVGTCYMPSDKQGVRVERYEDENGVEDTYEIPSGRLKEFLETGNFELVTESE